MAFRVGRRGAQQAPVRRQPACAQARVRQVADADAYVEAFLRR